MSESKVKHVDPKEAMKYINEEWDRSIQSTMFEYIKIPNMSPTFDSEYLTNGLVQKAMKVLIDWVESQKVPGLKVEVLSEPGRTPLIFLEIEGEGKTGETVLLYGHMDKQPPTTGWAPGLHPYTPVLRDGKIYGRGGADDGYAIFAAVSAIKIAKLQGVPIPHCVIMIESCEESGSKDLMHYVTMKKKHLDGLSLVVCLDSGCGNYEQLWLTSSLRGMLLAELQVKILHEGVHSGSGSGIVPSTFRILRQIMDRIEDSKTGELLIKEAYTDIPPKYSKYAEDVASTLGSKVLEAFKFVEGAHPIGDDLKELLLNQTWRPTLCTTGIGGVPSLETAGNVLRPETTVKLSVRLPPTVHPDPVATRLKEILEKDAPYGAHVKLTVDRTKCNPGWCSPQLAPWLEKSLLRASNTYYGKPFRVQGEGGSIPFMGMLGREFPATQFVITGLLGPGSNAHGPNEFLHIECAKKLTCTVASVLSDHYVNRVLKIEEP